MAVSLPRAILSRLLAMVGVVVAITAITYVMLHVLRPEAFPDAPALHVGLLRHLRDVFLHGDFGLSRQRPFQPVSEIVRHRLGADLSLIGGALAFGLGAGCAGGIVCARAPRSLPARMLETVALFALCTPVYLVGLMTILLLAPEVDPALPIGLVKTGTYQPLDDDPLAWLSSLLVPWIIVGAPLAAMCFRMIRATAQDVQDQPYLRTAAGKGLPAWRIAWRHTLPAAAAPAISLTASQVQLLVANALLIEIVFNIPGAFRASPSAVDNGNFELLQALTVVAAAIVVLATAVADVVLLWLDPRRRR